MKFDDEAYDSDKLFGYDSMDEDDESHSDVNRFAGANNKAAGGKKKFQSEGSDEDSDSYDEQQESVGQKRKRNMEGESEEGGNKRQRR